jgi:tetratricopeptide (TPR) repeat protein
MGRKPAGTRKCIYLSIASLIFLPLFGCVAVERTKERVEMSASSAEAKKTTKTVAVSSETKEGLKINIPVSENAQEEEKKKGQIKANQYLIRGEELLVKKDFEGSLKENQKVLSLSPNRPPGDEALFNIGLIYAHPGNPKKDYGKSLSVFKKLTKDYPQSSCAEQAKIWAEVLQENETLKQVIEKLKQVAIEIEEKKREKVR